MSCHIGLHRSVLNFSLFESYYLNCDHLKNIEWCLYSRALEQINRLLLTCNWLGLDFLENGDIVTLNCMLHFTFVYCQFHKLLCRKEFNFNQEMKLEINFTNCFENKFEKLNKHSPFKEFMLEYSWLTAIEGISNLNIYLRLWVHTFSPKESLLWHNKFRL